MKLHSNLINALTLMFLNETVCQRVTYHLHAQVSQREEGAGRSVEGSTQSLSHSPPVPRGTLLLTYASFWGFVILPT